jgi:hypothetical protein
MMRLETAVRRALRATIGRVVSRATAVAAAVVTASHAANSTPALAQQASSVVRATTGWAYTVESQPATPTGVLILMPGHGGSVGDFSDFATPTSARPPLADSLARHGIGLVFVAPPPGVLFGGHGHIQQLEDTIVEALSAFGDKPLRLAIGGFSAGGTDAILLAERCGKGACRMGHSVKAVFAVDAPLDWFRLWDNAVLAIAQAPARANLTEARLLRSAIESRIGRQPTRDSRAYLAASPLASRSPDGGNARALTTVAVRAYTEPDVEWWMENRNGDYYGMNSLDAAALVLHLRLLGNARAELVATTGKGFRTDGRRHPHSWSIVDQPELARWIAAELTR